MEDIGTLESMHAAAVSCIMDEGRLRRQQPKRTLSLSTLCDPPVTYPIYNAIPLSYLLNKHPQYHILYNL